MKEKSIITLVTEEKEVAEFSTAEKLRILINREHAMSETKLSRLLGYSKQKVSTNINKNSLPTSDLDQIADMLGYEVVFVKKTEA